MTATNAGRWFVLNLDDEAAVTAEAGATRASAIGEIVQIERSGGDCCGCCGPILEDPRGRGGASAPFLGVDIGVGRFVGGAFAFVGGVLAATVLTVVVWSLDSYGGAAISGVGDVASGELGSGGFVVT